MDESFKNSINFGFSLPFKSLGKELKEGEYEEEEEMDPKKKMTLKSSLLLADFIRLSNIVSN